MRRIFAIALLLTVFLPSIAFARTAYLCGIDGKSRAHCCCPDDEQDGQDATPITSARPTSCCEVQPGHAATVAPAEVKALNDRADAPLPIAAALVATIAPPPTLARTVTTYASQAPPDPGTALFVRHCSFLL